MSYSQTIKDILNILDLNIIFNENCLSTEKIKGVFSRIFHGFLEESPTCCPHCQSNHSNIIKWGYTTSLIKMPSVSEYVTYIRLKKRRFFCKKCDTTFVLDTPFVSRNNSISNNLKRLIAKQLTSKHAMSDIAKQTSVSTSTVSRVLKEWYEPIKKYSYELPSVLCFDEFKSVKKVAGSMSFIMMNGETNELIDILPDRRLPKIENYFNGFSLANRKQVKYVVSDIYQPYITLTKRVFPNAKVVLDKFHLVQHLGRAFQKIRIKIMTQLKCKDNGVIYRRIKKYWKLLQKSYDKLDYIQQHWRPSFKAYLSEKELLERLLTYDSKLTEAYNTYQQILRAIKTKDYSLFLELINRPTGFKEFIPVFKTFKKYREEIKNTFETSYSNGPLECMNNHIKVIKRNAYGMRSFYNFKLRLSICLKESAFTSPKKI
ncbi:hypothetical protein BW731_10075 [Vagococcus martis]|uniref:ISL3 family transposase n=1 Tax=Vagococcus martis TaxID=1768210 RepID=A0A1V4DJ11_9ENTE|nr:ISL3 family transposase [Vagococcus martis]OPF88495.1 hypothetical protein BW731_10075 [Vagococcus martis]